MMKTIPMLLVALVAANSFAAAEAPKPCIADVPVPVSCDTNHWWWKAHEYRYDHAKAMPDVEVAFLGDSIIHYFEQPSKEPLWKKYFAGTPYKGLNLAIEGDETRHLLWRIGEGKELSFGKPGAIVVLIGTNNFGKRNEDPTNTLAGIEKIVTTLRADQPQAKILLYKMLPRGKTTENACCRRCIELNKLMEAKYRADDRVILRDIYAKFLKEDGTTVDKELLEDYLHPAPKGYEVWLADLLPELKKILGK